MLDTTRALVGSVLADRYRLDRLLARSGMADVYAATDELLDRPVALKLLRGDGAIDRDRFHREMRLLARLDHPNLVRLLDAGEHVPEDGTDHDVLEFLVLELVEGPTLARRLDDGPLPADDVERLARELASALAYVHEHGVVHRDVKPSNVLFDADGRARLSDFGIARVTDATPMTGTAFTMGTAAYMAPEQVSAGAVTGAADVYSLGLVLLECLTGRRAFSGLATEAAIARLSCDPDIPADVPQPLASLLAAMTSREPTARPSAADVAVGADDTDADADATIAMPVSETVTTPADDATVAMPGRGDAAPPPRTEPLAAPVAAPGAQRRDTSPAANAERRHRRRSILTVALVAVALGALAVGTVLALTDRGGDAPFALDGGTSEPDAAAAAASDDANGNAETPATAPPTTAAPATSAPAPVLAFGPDCGALEAQRRALDEAHKGMGPIGGAVDKKAIDAERRSLDEQLKACR